MEVLSGSQETETLKECLMQKKEETKEKPYP
jgi:hypothetical protein